MTDAIVALRDVRDHRLRRWTAIAVAAVVGGVAATIHPIGLLLGGALVGLPSRTIPRAIAAGLAFGVAVLAVFVVGTLPGGPRTYLALTPISYLGIGIALGVPLVGSLVRGVV